MNLTERRSGPEGLRGGVGVGRKYLCMSERFLKV